MVTAHCSYTGWQRKLQEGQKGKKNVQLRKEGVRIYSWGQQRYGERDYNCYRDEQHWRRTLQLYWDTRSTQRARPYPLKASVCNRAGEFKRRAPRHNATEGVLCSTAATQSSVCSGSALKVHRSGCSFDPRDQATFWADYVTWKYCPYDA